KRLPRPRPASGRSLRSAVRRGRRRDPPPEARMLLTTRARGFALALLVMSQTPFARADSGDPGDPDKQQGVDDYVSGQRARKAGKLLEARHRFAVCGHAACPHAFGADCRRWRDEVDASIPSVVFDVHDRRAAAAPVRVTMDGAPLAGALEGRSIQVDPGTH